MDSENTGTVTLRAINIKIIFLKHDPHHAAVVPDCPAWGLRPARIYGRPDLHLNVILPLTSCVLWGEGCTSLSLCFLIYRVKENNSNLPKVIARIR